MFLWKPNMFSRCMQDTSQFNTLQCLASRDFVSIFTATSFPLKWVWVRVRVRVRVWVGVRVRVGG